MNKPPIRVALVTGGLPFGGTTTFLLNLACGLSNAHVPCEIYSLTRDNPLAADFVAAGIPVHAYDQSRTIFEDRLIQAFTDLAQFKPTVVLANIGCEAYEMLRYLPKGIARVGMVHDLVMRPDRLIPTYRETLDHVVVVAAHLVAEIRKAAPEIPCTYLSHGIPISADTPLRTSNPDRPLKLIYYGRLIKGKGTRIFPQIMEALRRHQIPFRWTLHGSGEEEPYLRRRLAEEATRDEVIFSTPISRAALPALVRQHDVYIHAGDTEGGPLTLLESMALGLVPVCGDIPCLIQEVITAENGFRVSRTDASAFADAIATLHADRIRLERMSQAARATVASDFSIQAMARRYLFFFESLKNSAVEPAWPQTIHVQPILGANAVFRWELLRGLRRLLKGRRK